MKFALKGRSPQHDYSLIDWSKTTDQIAAELGIRRGNASRLRRKHAPNTIGQHQNKSKIKYRVDWKKVDWNKKTKQIALDLSVPYESVNQARRKHAPETIVRRKRFKY